MGTKFVCSGDSCSMGSQTPLEHPPPMHKDHRFKKGLGTMNVPLVVSPCLFRKRVPD